MKYLVVALALCGSTVARSALAQDATSLAGSGTHLKGNGSGPDGLGTTAGTTGGAAGPKVAPTTLGGDTSGTSVTPGGTPVGRGGAAATGR